MAIWVELKSSAQIAFSDHRHRRQLPNVISMRYGSSGGTKRKPAGIAARRSSRNRTNLSEFIPQDPVSADCVRPGVSGPGGSGSISEFAEHFGSNPPELRKEPEVRFEDEVADSPPG